MTVVPVSSCCTGRCRHTRPPSAGFAALGSAGMEVPCSWVAILMSLIVGHLLTGLVVAKDGLSRSVDGYVRDSPLRGTTDLPEVSRINYPSAIRASTAGP